MANIQSNFNCMLGYSQMYRCIFRSLVVTHTNCFFEVMRLVLTFVRSRLSQNEWTEIQVGLKPQSHLGVP